MTYRVLLLGDANVARFWEAAQVARPQLVGMTFKPVSCSDTFAASLQDVNDGFDYVLVSVLTSLLLEECLAAEIEGTSMNIIPDLVKQLCLAAKKSSKVEVCKFWVYVIIGERYLFLMLLMGC